ncbi:NAD(P)-binding protein [Zopfia rhizophila CBS 207.26]|uniref:Short-chain dehydrogenase/reductase 3 n=1 Tax=Zopfia rhizophila CBS 207.26 TaxID=1314779 RepID=A0A6A6EX64_9PEZI|nr:NAD(P)-binding protein [Zopfia rhizophila CBS 207.26]
MPMRSEWKLAREGVTADTLGRLVHRTLLNPALTLPLVLLARYTQKGNALSQSHGAAFKWLKTLLYTGLASRVSSFLDDAVTNNWSNDTYDWMKEVVVVTGGSDGIGKIVVELFAERGIKVAVLDVQPLTFDAPPSVRFFKCDLASTSSIAQAASEIKVAMGNPTVLINNAGCARGKSILDASESDIRLTFNVNTLSHYFLAQQFLPSMIERNHGMIVTVASYAAYVTAPNMVDYAASKSAALAFHEGLSAELPRIYKASKVRTVIMCQSYTRTKLFEGFDSKALYPETVAEDIVRAVLAGKSKHILTPAAGWYFAAKIRGWPMWMQYGLRKRLDNLMKKWNGRQVQQPSLEKLGESGVLVPQAS